MPLQDVVNNLKPSWCSVTVLLGMALVLAYCLLKYHISWLQSASLNAHLVDSFFYKDNISNKTKGTIGAGGESQDPITTIPDKKRKAS